MSYFALFVLSQIIAVGIGIWILKTVLNKMLCDMALQYLRVWRLGEDTNPPKTMVVIYKGVLSPKFIADMKASIQRNFPSEMAVTYQQDPAIWGGMILKIDDHVLDCSLRDRMRRGFKIG